MSLMYLEDYLELVSFLPQEFRERLTKVRELDLEASNRRDNIEKLKKRLHRGIVKCENMPDSLPVEENLSANDRAGIVAEISSEYDKIVNLGMEKVGIVSGLEEMMTRYNRRLAADTEKFKLELEADNPGVTESLEARAEAEMRNFYDGGAKVVLTEAPRMPSSRRISDMGMIVAMQKKALLQGNQTGGTNMLARAASQAITATQHMQHGRRTASLKASYEAVRNTPTTTTSSRAGSGDRDDSSTRGDGRRARTGRGHRKVDVEEVEDVGTDAQDDDKRPYCFCRQPSLGFMVACDNRRCPIEWYHGSCVNVTADDVEGKQWFCPSCLASRNRKKTMVKQSDLKQEPGVTRTNDGFSKFGKKLPRKFM